MTQADSSSPPPSHFSGETGKRSYWLYGSNVAILVIIAVVIITLLMTVTAPIKAKHDFTANGAYSLSGYTQQLLKKLDQQKEKYELINIFRPSDSRQQQVQDILDEYARASNNITVEDVSQLTSEQIVQKIRDRYASEITPYDNAITEYRKVSNDLEKFLKAEAANAGAVAQQPGADENTRAFAAQLQGLFVSQMPDMLSATRHRVSRFAENTSPDYSAAVNAIKETLGEAIKPLTALSNPKEMADTTPAIVKYLTGEKEQYTAIVKEVKDFTDKLDKLQPLKVADVLNNLAPGSVVLIGPKSAAVVGEAALYKAPADENSQAVPAFQGEQAISSAFLPMIEPNKVKVVFISTSAALHPTTSTSEEGWASMAERLRGVNFDVQEWSPPGPPTGQDQTPPPANPPAEGKGVVWIVFPPDPANPQAMMMGMPPPSPQPVIDAVKKHLDEGGQVLFLADAISAGGMFGQSDGYAYADLLKPFGIEVQAKYTVVHNYPDPNGDRRLVPQLLVNHYKDHPITKPLQALQTAFVGFGSRSMQGFFGGPTIVNVSKPVPAGVDAQVIVDSPNDADTWAQGTYNQTAPFNKETDLAAPCPLAAAAVKDAGKEDEQRIVVISSRTVGANSIVDNVNARENESGSTEIFVVNPGNGELLTNSVLWLGGYKNMIAVSAKSAAAARIRSIPASMMTFIDFMLYVGLPLCALVLGGVVYMFRRR